MMTSIFTPFEHPKLHLNNRIGLSPMSMYQSVDGILSKTEQEHYAMRAMGGASLIFTGTIAVLPEGRITPSDPGLWQDEQIAPLAEAANAIRKNGGVPAIQLGHAGRKASTTVPWKGGRQKQDGRSLNVAEGAWQTLAPSALAFGDNKDHFPKAMSLADIQHVISAFRDAAKRADTAGFDVLEVHAAHGYLLHQFYSPLTNKRNDEYGGSSVQRSRLLLEVLTAIREVWPKHKALALRLNLEDFCQGGMSLEDGLTLATEAVDAGVDILDPMSFGGISPLSDVPWERNFTAEHAQLLKTRLPDVPVMLSAQSQADFNTPAEVLDDLLQTTSADIVLLGRQLLANPFWPAWAARSTDHSQTLLPPQYEHWLSGRSNEEKAHATA